MNYLVSETGRAVAAFWECRFDTVLSILYQTWSQWSSQDYRRSDMDDALYNALVDAVEMTELIAEHSPMIEKTQENMQLFRQLNACLGSFTLDNEKADWQGLCLLMPDFQQLLWAWSLAADFLISKGFDLIEFPPKVSFKLTAEGYICLYAIQDIPNALPREEYVLLQQDFNALFEEENTADLIKSHEEQIALKLSEKKWQEALFFLEQLLQQFPQESRTAFKRMGDIYMIIKEFNKAADCYMKSMVLGEPTQSFISSLRQAATYLEEQCETAEDRARWENWLQSLGIDQLIK